MNRILAAAERLLLKHGLERLTSPMVARAARVPAASVYQFFPTKFAIYNVLADRYIEEFRRLVEDEIERYRSRDWRAATRFLIRASAKFYEKNPAAAILLLNASTTPEIISADAAYEKQLLQKLIDVAESRYSYRIKRGAPHPALVAWHVVYGIFRWSQRDLGHITPAAVRESELAAIRYLTPYIRDERGSRGGSLRGPRSIS